MSTKGFTNKVFTQLVEALPATPGKVDSIPTEGIVTSVNEFFLLIQKANDSYNTAFNIAEDEKLIIAEEFPHELLFRLNDSNFDGVIDTTTQKKVRLVTYQASEKPASVSSHKYDEEGIRNIKDRLIDVREDPEYTGYSILRYGKDIEAIVDFKVWGLNALDVRERSNRFREMIDLNTWYFKHKGLREIIWLGSSEWVQWDGKNIIKSKDEKYIIRFTNIKELREKNIEQIVIQTGVDNTHTTTVRSGVDFFTPE